MSFFNSITRLLSLRPSTDSFKNKTPFLDYERIVYHLSRGDLIEIKRNGYNHWVICESIDSYGTVWCFHVTLISIEPPLNHLEINSTETSTTTTITNSVNAILKYEPLQDILKDNSDGKPSLCRLNNQQKRAKQKLNGRDVCDRDLDELFKVLHQTKDRSTPYDLKTNNCEHYVTQWKYGIGWSSQLNALKQIVATFSNTPITGSYGPIWGHIKTFHLWPELLIIFYFWSSLKKLPCSFL